EPLPVCQAGERMRSVERHRSRCPGAIALAVVDRPCVVADHRREVVEESDLWYAARLPDAIEAGQPILLRQLRRQPWAPDPEDHRRQDESDNEARHEALARNHAVRGSSSAIPATHAPDSTTAQTSSICNSAGEIPRCVLFFMRPASRLVEYSQPECKLRN